jgi:hypothetical protein
MLDAWAGRSGPEGAGAVKIYLVLGEINDWDDREVWPVIAYREREGAEAHAVLAKARADEWQPPAAFEDPPDGWNAHDPKMRGWRGEPVEYFVEEIELFEPGRG